MKHENNFLNCCKREKHFPSFASYNLLSLQFKTKMIKTAVTHWQEHQDKSNYLEGYLLAYFSPPAKMAATSGKCMTGEKDSFQTRKVLSLHDIRGLHTGILLKVKLPVTSMSSYSTLAFYYRSLREKRDCNVLVSQKQWKIRKPSFLRKD